MSTETQISSPPVNGNAGEIAPSSLEQRKYGGEPSMRRVKQLLEELFGHGLDAQIQGLLRLRKGVTAAAQASAASEEAISEAYRRGRADLQAEIVFAERLASVRARFPDFDRAWAEVKPLVPRAVWTEIAELEHGLEGAYRLSKLPELCRELSEMEPEHARQRFRHFVRDLTILKGTR